MNELLILQLIDENVEGLNLYSIAEIIGEEKEEVKKIIDKLVSLGIVRNMYGRYIFADERLHVGKIVRDHDKLRLLTKDKKIIKADTSVYKENSSVIYKCDTKTKYRVIYNISSFEKKIGEVVFEAGVMYLKTDTNKVVINDDRVVNGNIVEYTMDGFNVSILNVIGHKDDANIEIKTLAHKYNIITSYPPEVEEEAKNAPIEVSNEEILGMVDLRGDKEITIDCDTTNDMDDGVFYVGINKNGNRIFRANIADVPYAVKKGSASDKHANKVTTSHYPRGYAIHMLHPRYSSGICSLNENVDRITITFEVAIDSNGNYVDEDSRIYQSVTRSRKKTTYSKVNKLLDGEIVPDYMEYKDNVESLYEVSELIEERRKRSGLVTFPSRDFSYTFDNDRKIIDVLPVTRTKADKMIENLMIASGECLFNKLSNKGLSFIIRNEEAPDTNKIDTEIDALATVGIHIPKKTEYNSIDIQNILSAVKDREDSEVWVNRLVRRMTKAYYDTINIGHFGLAEIGYSQAPSPIRRNGDRINHTILHEHYFKNIPQSIDEKKRLTAQAKYLSKMELNAQSFERAVNNYCNARLMQEFIGKEFDAKVLDIAKDGIYVMLDNRIEGVINYRSIDGIIDKPDNYSIKIKSMNKNITLKLGYDVKVVLVKSDTEQRKINFEIKGLQKTLKRC